MSGLFAVTKTIQSRPAKFDYDIMHDSFQLNIYIIQFHFQSDSREFAWVQMRSVGDASVLISIFSKSPLMVQGSIGTRITVAPSIDN